MEYTQYSVHSTHYTRITMHTILGTQYTLYLVNTTQYTPKKYNVKIVISEVYAFLVLQCTVSGR